MYSEHWPAFQVREKKEEVLCSQAMKVDYVGEGMMMGNSIVDYGEGKGVMSGDAIKANFASGEAWEKDPDSDLYNPKKGADLLKGQTDWLLHRNVSP